MGGRKRRLSFRVAVAIVAMNRDAEVMANPLDCLAPADRDIEGASRTHRNSSYIVSRFRTFRDNGFHEIPRLKPAYDALPLRRCARETISVHAAHLA